MAARSPSAGRAPHTVSCSPDADTDGSPCSRRSLGGQPVTGVRVVLLLRTVSAVCRSPHSVPSHSSPMKGHALKESNAMVVSPSCPPPQDAPPSASGTAAGTARQPSFSAMESGDTPRRWGQGGVQQGEETGSASHVPSSLTTVAGTERTSRPVQIHPWLECYSWDHAVLRLRREKEGYWDALDRSAPHQPPSHREGRRFTPAS